MQTEQEHQSQVGGAGPAASTGLARFLAACRREQPDATPVWFMRQAGRCLAEYRELRKRYDILTMAKDARALCPGDADAGRAARGRCGGSLC